MIRGRLNWQVGILNHKGVKHKGGWALAYQRALAITNLTATPNSFSDGVNTNVQLQIHWDWDVSRTQKYKATFETSWRRDGLDAVYIKDITGQSFDINSAVPGTYDITVWAINPVSGIKSAPTNIIYSYRTTAGSSTLFPPINARVTGTTGLIYITPALSLSFDYNTANAVVADSLLDYVIELWNTIATVKYGTYTVKPNTSKNGLFNLPLMENIALFGTATRQYQIKIYSRDLTGFLSTAYAVVVNNTAPAIISFTSYPGVSSTFISVTTVPEPDVVGYQVYRSLTSGFTPGVTSDALLPIYDGTNSYISVNVPDIRVYYYKIAAYDSFGKSGLNFSSQQSVTALSLDAIAWSKTGITFAVGTTNQLTWTSGTITKQNTIAYTITSGSVAWITGTVYVYFNPAISTTTLQVTITLATAVGIGCYPLATYNGGDAANIKGGDGSAFISGSQIIAGTVGASQLITGSAVITSTAQIGSAVIADVLTSSTYNETAHTGWKLDKAGTFNAYGAINLYDTLGNTIFASGSGFNWRNVTGIDIPAVGANVAGNSSNLLTNAGMYLTADPWSIVPSSFPLYWNLVNWCIKDGGVLQGTIGASAGLPSDPALFLVSYMIPCIHGQLVEFSAYTGAHRCTVSIYAECYDSNNTQLGSNNSTAQNTAISAGGKYLSGYMRLGGFFTVPANAVKMRLVFHKDVTYTGPISSYGFMCLPYVGIASPNQTVLSDWSDGSSGVIKQIDIGNVSTYIANAAIGTAQIGSLNLTGLSTFIAPPSNSVIMDSNGMRVYDASGVLRVKFGNLA